MSLSTSLNVSLHHYLLVGFSPGEVNEASMSSNPSNATSQRKTGQCAYLVATIICCKLNRPCKQTRVHSNIMMEEEEMPLNKGQYASLYLESYFVPQHTT